MAAPNNIILLMSWHQNTKLKTKQILYKT